jgi:hypothetical protein
MLSKIAKIANKLDSLGMTKEADILDSVIQKFAQAQVATTGIAGGVYTGGRLTEQKEGGPTESWYASKPTTLAEFNKALAAMIQYNPKRFTKEALDLVSALQAETKWSDATNKAFKLFCSAIDIPQAGNDWANYAKANNYSPNIQGVFAFWEDNHRRLLGSFGERGEANIDYDALRNGPGNAEEKKMVYQPSNDNQSPNKYNNTQQADTGLSEVQLNKFVTKVWSQITGGTGFSITDQGITTLHGKIKNALRSLRTKGAVDWFNQDPRNTLPSNRIKIGNLHDWIMPYTTNEEILNIYSMIDQASKDAEEKRAKK